MLASHLKTASARRAVIPQSEIPLPSILEFSQCLRATRTAHPAESYDAGRHGKYSSRSAAGSIPLLTPIATRTSGHWVETTIGGGAYLAELSR